MSSPTIETRERVVRLEEQVKGLEAKITSMDAKVTEMHELLIQAKGARTWDYDGETMVGEGVSLDPDIEAALEQIASILTDRRRS